MITTLPTGIDEQINPIIEAAETKYRLWPGAVVGRSKKPRACAARREVAHELQAIELFDGVPLLTKTDIGEILGGRDHSSICYLLRD